MATWIAEKCVHGETHETLSHAFEMLYQSQIAVSAVSLYTG